MENTQRNDRSLRDLIAEMEEKINFLEDCNTSINPILRVLGVEPDPSLEKKETLYNGSINKDLENLIERLMRASQDIARKLLLITEKIG